MNYIRGWLEKTRSFTCLYIGIFLLMLFLPMRSVSAWQETRVEIEAFTMAVQETAMVNPTTTTLPTTLATPTIDATVTALNKEKLAQEVQQLRNQNEPDIFSLLQTNAGILFSTFVVVIGGLVGLFRWFGDRRDEQEKRRQDQRSEREKRDEDRFQGVVAGLGSERIEARVGAAIMLRTFLHEDYKEFYSQAFDLAVAHLRLRQVGAGIMPVDSLSQALIVVLKESFPLARKKIITEEGRFDPMLLDATGVNLDNAYLSGTNLQGLYMRGASLRKVFFRRTQLEEAYLKHANLEEAFLQEAHLEGANLGDTVLISANLNKAYLQGAHLMLADLTNADLTDADLTGTRPEGARSLNGTKLRGVHGLTPGGGLSWQLHRYHAVEEQIEIGTRVIVRAYPYTYSRRSAKDLNVGIFGEVDVGGEKRLIYMNCVS
jgi:hypothetical protein